MNTKKNEQQYLNELSQHLLSMKEPDQMEEALRGLLTPSELSEISKRLQIFKLLREGMPQRQIAEKLGVGIATVTRGSRALKEIK
ncbi:Trp family transcriptional regulator [Oceanospirillum sediminis]|uniref:Helix-turn-helix domain-containing protein n=1 Tax=Oceanospirillum sediminis TaxID=2760088 RepID=A0A839IU63_9GAMM|nr:Trp family transcriptional regulator [Oceanospirillum sediminis]MBB1488019.1 helix-turn-helix domain-containing protein [Oceanospirillum sediminis]